MCPQARTLAPCVLTPTNACRHRTGDPSLRGANGWRTVKYKGTFLQKIREKADSEVSKGAPVSKQKTAKDTPLLEQSSPTSITTPTTVLPKTLPVNSHVLDTNAPGKNVLVVVRTGKKYGFTRPLGDLDSDESEAKWLLTDLLSAHHDYLRWRQNEKKKNERKSKEKEKASTLRFRVGVRVEANSESSGWARGKIAKVHRQLRPGIPRWAFAQVNGDEENFLRRVDMPNIHAYTYPCARTLAAPYTQIPPTSDAD